MNIFAAIVLLLPSQAADVEPEHAANSIFRDLMTSGFQAESTKIVLPGPKFHDSQKSDERRALLREVAGSPSAGDELLRDSVSAPFILKLRDEKLADSTLRIADLWFVVYADLDAIDPAESARQTSKPTEAANMRLEPKLLSRDQVQSRKLPFEEPNRARNEWYAHLNARLLDRIAVDSTDHVIVTRSADSLVIASRTDPAFNGDREFPNRWQSLNRSDPSKAAGSPHPYAGGVSYVKISKLGDGSRALLVEGHFAFVEPAEWFDRAPVLRSKFSIVAQDQIRRLRRQAAEVKRKP